MNCSFYMNSFISLRSLLLPQPFTMNHILLYLLSFLSLCQGFIVKPRIRTVPSAIVTMNVISRKSFIQLETKSIIPIILLPWAASAFDGGVGGLGKSKPDTGVIFSNTDLPLAQSTGSDITTELLSPDKRTPVLLSFYAPWPLLHSTAGIETRDLSNPESAFVSVSSTTGIFDASNIPLDFFANTIFGSLGKFGMYGPVSDLKVKKIMDKKQSAIYLASFTTLTPAMRESERKAYISASVVGNGVFMLVCSSTAARFKAQNPVLWKIADSFSCVEAPKSQFRR